VWRSIMRVEGTQEVELNYEVEESRGLHKIHEGGHSRATYQYFNQIKIASCNFIVRLT
jgi:hypothetical protein